MALHCYTTAHLVPACSLTFQILTRSHSIICLDKSKSREQDTLGFPGLDTRDSLLLAVLQMIMSSSDGRPELPRPLDETKNQARASCMPGTLTHTLLVPH